MHLSHLEGQLMDRFLGSHTGNFDALIWMVLRVIRLQHPTFLKQVVFQYPGFSEIERSIIRT